MRRGVPPGSASVNAVHYATRAFFFNKKATDTGTTKESDTAAQAPGPARSLNLKDMQAFMKASPQQQLETMQKALDMQKSLAKVPGLGILAKKNAAMMERVIQMQQQATSGVPVDPAEKKKIEDEMKGILSQRGVDVDQAAAALKQQSSQIPPPPPPRKGSGGATNTGTGSTGPSLDELRRVNLGSEIEALFQELRSLRESKNSYRDKFNAREKECDSLQQEARSLRETEASIRSKLQLAEKNVVLLNSENMTLREGAKRSKELESQLSKMTSKVTSLQSNDTQPLLFRIQALEGELRAKEDHNRSLARKLERTRRRDPLLQFSQVCSTEPMLLSAALAHPRRETATADVAPTAVEEAFARLRDAYDAEQKQRWLAAATAGANAAKVMVAAAAEVMLSRLGAESKFDAVLQLEGSAANDASNDVLSALRTHGFVVEKDAATVSATGKWYVLAQPDAPTPTGLGPYGYACALVLSSAYAKHASVTIGSVAPRISKQLALNPKRCTVQYESCRSGGPGGQAANVTETQITAKLFVDNTFVMQAEAQDSRSAVANKESATDRLQNQARKKWNDRAALFDADQLRADVAASFCAQTTTVGLVSATYGEEYLGFVADAAAQQPHQAAAAAAAISRADAAVVYAVESLRSQRK